MCRVSAKVGQARGLGPEAVVTGSQLISGVLALRDNLIREQQSRQGRTGVARWLRFRERDSYGVVRWWMERPPAQTLHATKSVEVIGYGLPTPVDFKEPNWEAAQHPGRHVAPRRRSGRGEEARRQCLRARPGRRRFAVPPPPRVVFDTWTFPLVPFDISGWVDGAHETIVRLPLAWENVSGRYARCKRAAPSRWECASHR